MIADHPIDVMLMATDLGVVRRCYGDTIAFEVPLERDGVVPFDCCGDGRLGVTRTGVARSEQQTIASWRTADAALSTWLVDPGGNTIGLLQFKDKGLG